MQQLTVSFSEETLAALDEVSEMEYGGDRDEAVRALLDDWIAER